MNYPNPKEIYNKVPQIYKNILMIFAILAVSISCSFGESKASPNIPKSSPTSSISNTRSEISWWWPNPIDQVDPVSGIVKAEVLANFDSAKKLGINTLFIDASQIPWQVLNLPDKVESFRFAFDRMTYEANLRGVKVFALIAGNDWTNVNGKPGFERVEDLIAGVNYLAKWNSNPKNKGKIDGVTFDIEVHLNDIGNSPQQQIDYANYLDAISKSAGILKGNNLIFDVTSSAYTAGELPNIYPNLKYGGITDSLTSHLMRILNNTMNGKATITLMSYRPSAVQTEQIAADEFAILKKNNYQGVKLNIAQETYDEGVNNPNTSYFGMSPTYTLGEFQAIRNYYLNNNFYGGIAIHDLRSYLMMNK